MYTVLYTVYQFDLVNTVLLDIPLVVKYVVYKQYTKFWKINLYIICWLLL